MKRVILLLACLLGVGGSRAQQAFTLEECRDLALRNNKELRISGERVKMADYERRAALTKYFPQLSANGAYMWNQKDFNLLDMASLNASLGASLGGLAQLPVVQQLVGKVDNLQHLDVQNIWVGNVSLV